MKNPSRIYYIYRCAAKVVDIKCVPNCIWECDFFSYGIHKIYY